MTDSVKSAHSKISDKINKLSEVSATIDQNKNDILLTTKKQEELEGLINSHIQAPRTTPGLITGSKGISIETVMVNQAQFRLSFQALSHWGILRQ